MTTFSSKNMNTSAPLWFRRLETALIFLIMGAIPLIGMTKSISVEIRDDITYVILPAIVLLIKSIGILLGERLPRTTKKP